MNSRQSQLAALLPVLVVIASGVFYIFYGTVLGGYLTTGQVALKAGRFQEAFDAFDKISDQLNAIYPNEISDSHIWKGRADLSLKRFGDAAEEFRKVVEIKPVPELNYERGVADLYGGKLPAALEHFSEAMEHEADPRYYVMRGITFQKMGILDKALWDYTRALEISPGYKLAQVKIAQIKLAQGKPDEAIQLCTATLKTSPPTVTRAPTGTPAPLTPVLDPSPSADSPSPATPAPSPPAPGLPRATALTPATVDALPMEQKDGLAYSVRALAYQKLGKQDLAAADLAKSRALGFDSLDE